MAQLMQKSHQLMLATPAPSKSAPVSPVSPSCAGSFELPWGQALSLKPQVPCVLTAVCETLWLTTGSSQDVLLRPGQSAVLPRGAHAVIEAHGARREVGRRTARFDVTPRLSR